MVTQDGLNREGERGGWGWNPTRIRAVFISKDILNQLPFIIRKCLFLPLHGTARSL